MEWRVLQSKKNPTPSAAALPPTHREMQPGVFLTAECLLLAVLKVSVPSGNGAVWGCLCVFCASTHFSKKFSYPFLLSPHFFCMRPLCTDPFRPCFSLSTYDGHYVPYLYPATHLFGKTRNQADSGVQYLLTPVIYSLSCSLPWHLSFWHSSQQGLMPSKCLSGSMT